MRSFGQRSPSDSLADQPRASSFRASIAQLSYAGCEERSFRPDPCTAYSYSSAYYVPILLKSIDIPLCALYPGIPDSGSLNIAV